MGVSVQEAFERLIKAGLSKRLLREGRLEICHSLLENIDYHRLDNISVDVAAEEFLGWCDNGFPLSRRPKWLAWQTHKINA